LPQGAFKFSQQQVFGEIKTKAQPQLVTHQPKPGCDNLKYTLTTQYFCR